MRQRILDAARELLLRQGYEAVTMREIASRIEYSATALYGHFADKEALVRELCRQDFATFAQRFLNIAQVEDPIERFCRAGLVYLDFAREYPQHYRFMFLTEIPPSPPEAGERDDPAQNAYVFLRGLVGDLLQRGALRAELSDVELVSQTIWALVHGTAALELMLPTGGPWLDFRPRQERVAAALELAAFGLLRDPEAGIRTVRRVLADHAAEGRSRAKSRKRKK